MQIWVNIFWVAVVKSVLAFCIFLHLAWKVGMYIGYNEV